MLSRVFIKLTNKTKTPGLISLNAYFAFKTLARGFTDSGGKDAIYSQSHWFRILRIVVLHKTLPFPGQLTPVCLQAISLDCGRLCYLSLLGLFALYPPTVG